MDGPTLALLVSVGRIVNYWTAFIGVGMVFWMLAIHPFVTYPLSLSLAGWVRGGRNQLVEDVSAVLSVAICTCAYNEERVIGRKIANLLSFRERHPDLEILIYVDGSSDRTGEIVDSYSNVLTADISTERHGKTHGMNRLVARSLADIIIFTDANVLMDADAVANALRQFTDPSIGCLCGNLTYTNPGESVTASTGSIYWRLEQFIKRRETKFGAVMGADGSLFAIRRCLHRAPPDHIIDDMYVSLQIMCEGYRVIQVDEFIAFEESVTVGTEEFRRKVRIACQAFNVHRLMWPALRACLGPFKLYMYLSHKWLRWLCIYFIGIGSVLICVGLFLADWAPVAAGFAGVTALSVWAGAKFDIPILSSLVDVLTALLGAGVGVWQAMRGHRFQTWQPAASIRR